MRKNVALDIDHDDGHDTYKATATMKQFLTEAQANYRDIFGAPSSYVCLIEMRDGEAFDGRLAFLNESLVNMVDEQFTQVTVDATGLIEFVFWSVNTPKRHYQVLILDRDRYNKVHLGQNGETLVGAELFKELMNEYPEHRLKAGWADHYFTAPEDDTDVIEAAIGCYW